MQHSSEVARLVRLSVTLCVFSISPIAAAQTRIEVRAEARPGLADNSTAKLSPELQTALESKAKFVGVNRATSHAVLEFSENLAPTWAMEALADVDGVVERREFTGDQIDRIDELIVFYDGPAPVERNALAELEVTGAHEPGKFVVVKSEDGFSSDELARLKETENVTYVEPSFRYYLSQIPDDPYLLDLWGMRHTNAATAWEQNHDAPEIIVAVLDTGVDYKHEDLASNMWRNSNGKHGYDFVNDDDDPMDGHGHGTHCAGTIAAEGNNGRGVVGVTWKTQIMAIKIFSDSGDSAGADKIAKAIDYAVANGARVLSNSWGGGNFSEAVQQAISRAEAKNVLFVAAAGNGGIDRRGDDNDQVAHYPSSYNNANIIAVLALEESDQLSPFSNYGVVSVDIGAPGGSIYSTTPRGRYGFKSGTSMATPHVAGAALLVWAKDPGQTAAAVKKQLLDNAQQKVALQGKCGCGGTLNMRFLGKRTPAQLQVHGTLQAPVFAIGGETTGIEIQSNQGTIELSLEKNPRLHARLKELAGKEVMVRGQLQHSDGVERPRRVLEVTSIKDTSNQ